MLYLILKNMADSFHTEQVQPQVLTIEIMPSIEDTVAQTATTHNTSQAVSLEQFIRPRRVSAWKGEQHRRNVSAKYKLLDIKLKRDMGTSSDETTKDGKPRLEYLGR
jgi:hypothetical protein